MEYTVGSLLTDVAIASIFILIAKVLREKIEILQKLFIPASLLAGFLGLLLGDNGFGLVHFSGQLGAYSGILIIVVFVTIGIRGFNFSKGGLKENFERIGAYYCFRNVGWAGQYSLPIILGIFVLPIFAPNLNPNFGMLIPAGFQGGHGTSAALGETLRALGWSDAADLAMTTATVGLMTGIFGGILLINIATKKGYTSYVKEFGELPDEMRTGVISPEKREDMGKETISSIALDPLAWHLALVAIPAGIGYVLTNFISEKTGLGVPAFSVGFLVAILFSFILKKTKADYTMDKKVISRIGGTATDFLVFFGIASIKVPVVLKYIVPFALLMLFGILWTRCRQYEGENGYAMVDLEDGDRVFLGSNKGGIVNEHPLQVSKEDFEYLKQFEIIHTSNNGHFTEQLKDIYPLGIPISFDFSGKWTDKKLVDAVAPYATFAFLSCGDVTEAEAESICKTIRKGNIRIVVATRGCKGSVLYDGRNFRVQEPHLVKPVDTLGAGDSFAAAFLVHMASTVLKKECDEETYQREVEIALDKAAEFSAKTCLVQGAFGRGKVMHDRG